MPTDAGLPLPALTALVGHPLDPLIGRDVELAQIVALLGQSRLVTLTGPGGSGKTRLARAALGAIVDRDTAFVDLSAVRERDRFATAIAGAIGLQETADQDADAVLVDWAVAHEPVLGLDNLEQLPTAGALVSRLLDRVPSLTVLATSRLPLRVGGEVQRLVEPLALPPDDTAASVEASAAGALFLVRARAIGYGDLDEPSAVAIGRLCRRLDGLPLALELAAGRTRVLSPAAILERLERSDAGLMERDHGEPRHRSLARVLDWTIGVLAAEDRAALISLSVCRGGFDLAMAETLVAPHAEPLSCVERLLSCGLVTRTVGRTAEPRFRMLETVRIAAMEQGVDDALEGARSRHAAHLLEALVQRCAEIDGPASGAALADLDADRVNLEAALDWAAVHAPNMALDLVSAGYEYWAVRGQMRDGISRLRAAVGDPARASGRHARALAGLARLVFQAEGNLAALPYGELAVRLGREAGDIDAEIEGLQTVAYTALDSHPMDTIALRTCRRRAEELLDTGSASRRLRARLVVLAAVLGEAGYRGTEVLDHLAAAIADARAGEHSLTLAKLLGNRSLNHLARREGGGAISDAGESVALFAQIGDEAHEAWARNTWAVALAEAGRMDESIATFAASAEFAIRDRSRFQLMDVLAAAAAIASAAGDPRAAARLWGSAEAAFAPTPVDAAATERFIETAKTEAGAVAWAVGVAEGRASDPVASLRGFLATPPRADARARVRLRHGDLTVREVEILRCLAGGMSDREIGDRLFISPKTASVHVSNVKAKLGVETRLQASLAARAMDLGEDPIASPTATNRPGKS